MAQSVLVTGGAGYIGSHTVLQLLLGGYKPVLVDNLDNSSDIAIKRVQELAAEYGHNLSFHQVCCKFTSIAQYLRVIRLPSSIIMVDSSPHEATAMG
ncbi:unnamed protein product [Ilex paraguariensis]|uniref:UDP-glucose 4-epimerase n=1 Tax=Ilex paraguariensis TaxID=185542 RepID=A0ABC8RDW0_9AQUA